MGLAPVPPSYPEICSTQPAVHGEHTTTHFEHAEMTMILDSDLLKYFMFNNHVVSNNRSAIHQFVTEVTYPGLVSIETISRTFEEWN